MLQPHHRTRGFSLVELITAIGIIGTLVALALPQYQNFMGRARRTEAMTNLGNLAKAMESYYANEDTYTCDLNALGWAPEGGARFIYGFGIANASCPNYNDTMELAAVRPVNTELLVHRNLTPFAGSDLVFGEVQCGALPPVGCTASAGPFGAFSIAAYGNVDADDAVDHYFMHSRDYASATLTALQATNGAIQSSAMYRVRDDTDDSSVLGALSNPP